MEKSIEKKVEYLKEMSKTIYELSHDDSLLMLMEKINLLSKEEINKIIDEIYFQKFTPINFIRLIIALELQENKITLDKIEEIKSKFQNKDIEYFKQYPVNKKFFIKTTTIYQQKDTFETHISNFEILYVFFYYPVKDTIEVYINEIGDYTTQELQLKDYVVTSNKFDDYAFINLEEGIIIYIQNYYLSYKKSIMLSIEFLNGNIYSKTIKGANCKIDYIEKEQQCSNLQECIHFLQQNKDEFIRLNKGNKMKKTTKSTIISNSEYKFLSPEWFKTKATEDKYKNIDAEATKIYEDFQNEFSIEKIKALSGEELLDKIFLGKNKNNLCYRLEFDPKLIEFGSIKGGSSSKYGLYFSDKKKSWVFKDKEISNDTAINLAIKIKKELILGAENIKNYGEIKDYNDYLNIYTNFEKNKLVNKDKIKVWILKYYHMLFPNIFPPFYSDEWHIHILCNLGFVPKSSENFLRMGQIACFVKECNISNITFANIIGDYIGVPKKFFRIKIEDTNFDNWKTNNYVAIRWNELGNLNDFFKEKDEKNIKQNISVKLKEIDDNDKSTITNKTKEIYNFCTVEKEDSYIVAMYGKKILGLGLLNGDYYFNDKNNIGGQYAHCRKVKWLKFFEDFEDSQISEGYLTTFCELKKTDTICQLYSLLNSTNINRGEEMEINNNKKNQPLNQILYGPPGTGKTYNTVIKAMEIISFEDIFKNWYLIHRNKNVQDKDKRIKEYISHIHTINKEFLIDDNIFKYYEKEKFIKLKKYILDSKYMTEDSTRNNPNSYYRHCLIRYEEFLEWLTYEKIKEEFDKLKTSGQIEFITFHQSYSYEEFIEGIKPNIKEWETENNDITYIGKDGVLKDISNAAKSEFIENIAKNDVVLEKINIFKMSLGNTQDDNDTNIFDYCIKNNVVAIGYGNDINFSECKNENDMEKFLDQNKDKTNDNKKSIVSRMSTFKFTLTNNDLILISNGNKNIRAIAQVDGEYFFNDKTEINYNHFRKVKWLYNGENIPTNAILNEKQLSQKSIYKFNKEDINFTFLSQILNPSKDYKPKPYVLIIDEINRGNISKIFGEMITLIEEDKRIGNEHELKLTLPYSKKPFGIPNNLYIIGTMNTSDRSIASVDIALRRRFKFIEMMPKNELVINISIGNTTFQEIFKALNEKITILLDRDHQIGHSYFMQNKIKSIDDLKNVWFSEILPLLNEYFYNDWDKLQALLGDASKNNDSFITIKETKLPFYQYDIEDKVYDFVDKEKISDNNFELALLKIIDEPKNKQEESSTNEQQK